jgi:hypothetical protein
MAVANIAILNSDSPRATPHRLQYGSSQKSPSILTPPGSMAMLFPYCRNRPLLAKHSRFLQPAGGVVDHLARRAATGPRLLSYDICPGAPAPFTHYLFPAFLLHYQLRVLAVRAYHILFYSLFITTSNRLSLAL